MAVPSRGSITGTSRDQRIGAANLRTLEVSGLSLAGLAPTVVLFLGCLWRFRPKSFSPLTLAAVIGLPLVSAGLFGFAFYTSVIPQPALPYSLEPAAVAAVLLIAGGAVFWLKRRGHAVDFEVPEV